MYVAHLVFYFFSAGTLSDFAAWSRAGLAYRMFFFFAGKAYRMFSPLTGEMWISLRCGGVEMLLRELNRVGWLSLWCLLISWEIWKQRNTRVFLNIAVSVGVLVAKIKEECSLWSLAGAMHLYNIMAQKWYFVLWPLALNSETSLLIDENDKSFVEFQKRKT